MAAFFLAFHAPGINVTSVAASAGTRRSVWGLHVIPATLSIADRKNKYPIAETAIRKTMKMMIA